MNYFLLANAKTAFIDSTAAIGAISIAIRSITFSIIVPILGNILFIGANAVPDTTIRAIAAIKKGIIFSADTDVSPTINPIATKITRIHDIHDIDVRLVMVNPKAPVNIPPNMAIIIPAMNRNFPKLSSLIKST